jgi:hypothetical protein
VVGGSWRGVATKKSGLKVSSRVDHCLRTLPRQEDSIMLVQRRSGVVVDAVRRVQVRFPLRFPFQFYPRPFRASLIFV